MDKPVPSWELVRTVIHLPPSEAHYIFRLALFPTVTYRYLIYPSFLPNILSWPNSRPSPNWLPCALRYISSLLSSGAVRTSYQWSDISKLSGEVWMGSGIPTPSHFTPQMIFLRRGWVKFSLLPPNRAGRNSFINVASSNEKRGPTSGVTCWTNCHYFWSNIVRLS